MQTFPWFSVGERSLVLDLGLPVAFCYKLSRSDLRLKIVSVSGERSIFSRIELQAPKSPLFDLLAWVTFPGVQHSL